MRRDNIDNRYRFVLGQVATALTAEQTPPGEISRPDHLEAGIVRIQNELAIERATNRRLTEAFQTLDARFFTLLTAHNDGMRGLMMTVGQTVRELNVIRRVLIISGATSTEQAERLYDKALPAIMELRATMALWRQREGLEIPEFSLEEEERILSELIQSPATDRERSEDPSLSQDETVCEQPNRTEGSTDDLSSEKAPERDLEREND
ncbi:hypothetical protein M3484_16505 [Pseudomonas sp. GX19020]|uniref:hypothetical protein n=1 Tax=Pseudomonas sp. GX19020 TaxID=2942277 RepID=UPI00201957B3|nr:hypothetical protein [Pseudomonas sp. GX19020]MCL4068174.1 hypothetical protein [Pseudomonas sp. GX19020]